MTDFHLHTMQETASKVFNLQQIDPVFLADFVYNSLSFETDYISRKEVDAIQNGQTEGIEAKKVLLVQNHINAFNFVVEMLRSGIELDENKLKDLHEVLMKGIDVGGLYRNVDISIKGSNHTPPSHLKVYDRMKKYFDTLSTPTENVWERIAYSHVQLAKIHPFLDGNGRCARLVLNYMLMKHQLAPVVIPHKEKGRYFNALETFKVNKDIGPFVEYIKELELKTLGL
ncbi:MAG: Fic family protein [Acholeplasmataceae bacterium]|jgi:Fic family protein|nr:Fic family protein [Acholeplasmataceae bacterium]